MPYVDETTRRRIRMMDGSTETPGELAFAIADLLDNYVADRAGEIGFEVLAGALGALESARREFYDAVVKPYEARKCFTNGDVFEYSREAVRAALDEQ